MASINFKGRVDENVYEVTKRAPVKNTAPNHIYVKKTTHIAAQMKKVEKLLNENYEEIYLHGMGASLNRAIVLALEVQKKYHGGIKFHIRTSTINVADELFPMSDEYEMGHRNRPLSAVHIFLYRDRS